MNVLLMSRVILRTGVGMHVSQLCEELKAQGNKVTVVSSCNVLDVNRGGILS